MHEFAGMTDFTDLSIIYPMKKVVVIGGGTGGYVILSGLKKYPLELTAVVSMADDGGSTGILREEFGILPPGDIRRAILALSTSDNRIITKLFNYRFKEGTGLIGHNFGNLMLTALERITKSFTGAIEEAEKILEVKGKVLPSTLNKSRLYAELETGQIIKGETNIDIPDHNGNLRIRKVWLKPKAKINPAAQKAILAADAIVIGPGDLYTSIIPNLLVSGLPEAIRKSKAKKIFIVNAMTKFGETNNFRTSNFIRETEKYLGGDSLDYALINIKRPTGKRLKPYILEKASLVEIDEMPLGVTPVYGDFLRSRGFIRHDSNKLAKAIVSLI